MEQNEILGDENLCDLIMKGGVFADVEGENVEQIFRSLSQVAQMPAGVEKEYFVRELADREKVLSTAVGHGVAIPHPRKSILSDMEDQRVIVCYPKESMDMASPDGIRVFVMFVLLTKSSQVHFNALSDMAKLVHCTEFRRFLETKPDAKTLVDKIKNLQSQGIVS